MENKSGNSSESFFKKITYTDGIYPAFTIQKNNTPNRFYAVPLLGVLVKIVLLIPVCIILIFLGLWLFIIAFLINPLVVIFTGKYWPYAYQFSLGYIKLSD